ncbi:MAG TPA: DUF421 domain-containing protein [Symbiobacteriaceae bacterium]|nr:DUF421 domain-containing protein [Symbiobacteriaceae bacterium]
MAVVPGALGRVTLVMLTLLVAGLIMGQRKMGDLSLFDMLTGITIGAVAGASIAETRFRPILMVVSIIGLAALDFAVSWLMLRWRPFGRAVTFEPIVVIRKGKPVEAAMRRVRLAVADLLPELRKKEIFDLRAVEYAIFEPDGSLSILKAPDAPKPHGLPQAVVVDGAVDEKALHVLGWDRQRLCAELEQQGINSPEGVFLATLDESGALFAAPKEVTPGPPMHH